MVWQLWDMKWSHLVARGGLAVAFGVVAMLFPLSTAAALALLWGVWALADGVLTLVQAFGAPRSPVRAVFEQLALGGSYGDIARALFVTENTVKTHLASIYRKLGVERRAEALQVGRDRGLLGVGSALRVRQ